ncbi:MAG TPA: Crp/Fnr family transcriptional regulator [Myxococcota bacterium]|nr:Crp/Fnr family transcriptional regulator [Myxococcota bacterium]
MPTIENSLLAAVSRGAYRKLLPGLRHVALDFGDVLYELDGAIHEVYFPGDCLVSLLAKVDGHHALEVGMVGREGMVGVPLALGIATSPVRAVVQGGGVAARMSRARFLSAMASTPTLRREVNGYIHGLMGQITATAVCNRFHVVEGRLARWLLMTRDRARSGDFQMTHEYLATMLGVRREGVTVAASAFQRQMLIEYRRGHIRILDHAGLEAASCSCYRSAATGPGSIAAWRPAPSRAPRAGLRS